MEKGKIVLCDRFIDSSLAYQGYARGYGIEEIYKINSFAIGEYMPDLSILFDIEPSIGLDRIKKNSSREVNRLDKEKLEFHNKVREGYNEVLKTIVYLGEMSEWSKEHAWNACIGETLSWVQIPLSPPMPC